MKPSCQTREKWHSYSRGSSGPGDPQFPSQQRTDGIEVALLLGQGMGKAAADIRVATVVGQLDQQLPGGVVSQLDGEHGVQGLGQVGARIGNDLQRSGTQYPGQVGTGGLGGRVGAEGLDRLD